MRRVAWKAVLAVAGIAAPLAAAYADSHGCEAMPPTSAEFVELIVSPASPDASDELRDVLERAGIGCVAQLHTTKDCLVRYRRQGNPEPLLAVSLLKTNIHAISRRAFNAWDQRLIGDVFVNEGVEARAGESVSRPPPALDSVPRGTDPLFHKQVQLKAMKPELAWEGIGEHEPIVAILDDGVLLDHPDLKPNLLAGVTIGCGSTRCDGSPLDDTDGHGTKIAGIIAAAKGNDEGIVGLAWNAKILPINISAHGITDFTAACGVEVAIARGARIINASWWKTSRLKLLRKQLLAADDQVVFVAAAGSDGYRISAKHPSYPLLEELPNVIGVGANIDTDKPVSASNYSQRYVHVTAEALAFTTQYPNTQNPGLYETALGYTSFSTAYVSGLVALLKSRYPEWSHEWVRWRLISGSIYSQRLEHMSESRGRIDLETTMFPASTAAPVDRSGVTLLDWTRGLRSDMCAKVSISARIGEPGQMGAYRAVIQSTGNDGNESIAGNKLPSGVASRIQFLVTCEREKADAESPPIVLAR